MSANIATGKLRLGDIDLARSGVGTNRLTDTPQSVAFLKDAVAAGVNMIDTAHTYTGGESEGTIGAALSPFPDELVVATKEGYAPGHGRGRDLTERRRRRQ